jgi:hypothetical protein
MMETTGCPGCDEVQKTLQDGAMLCIDCQITDLDAAIASGMHRMEKLKQIKNRQEQENENATRRRPKQE